MKCKEILPHQSEQITGRSGVVALGPRSCRAWEHWCASCQGLPPKATGARASSTPLMEKELKVPLVLCYLECYV